MVRRLSFRGRLLLFLLSFALVPAGILSLAWAATGRWSFELISSTAAWDSVTASGRRATAAARRAPLDSATAAALAAHEAQLDQSETRARQAAYVFPRMAATLGAVMLLSLVAFGFLASAVAGHLSRALSRPLQELIGWADLIGRGEPLPEGPPRRGAPEFEVLRARMRRMATELELGRASALEAERARTMRESARQVAHELKNPLTPIRFAVERLRRDAPPELAETIDVLATESSRLELLARSFAQFGRLPEGPSAPIDIAELARYTSGSVVPPEIPVTLALSDDLPLVDAQHDALSRALANVLLNAVDACASANGRDGYDGSITVRVRATELQGRPAVELAVQDTGCGIGADALARIWDPYITSKPGGTGLGLAIVRQTIHAHGGEVSAESEPRVGTTIRLVLPASNGMSARAFERAGGL